MYQITADAANRRLEVDFIGSYTDIDQASFGRDLRAAALRVRGGAAHFDLLCDFTQVPVMPKDRTERARDEIDWCMANRLRRSANVVGGAIAKLQLQRLAADDRFRNFATRAEAIAWLTAPD